jgi:hypothetical protein
MIDMMYVLMAIKCNAAAPQPVSSRAQCVRPNRCRWSAPLPRVCEYTSALGARRSLAARPSAPRLNRSPVAAAHEPASCLGRIPVDTPRRAEKMLVVVAVGETSRSVPRVELVRRGEVVHPLSKTASY